MDVRVHGGSPSSSISSAEHHHQSPHTTTTNNNSSQNGHSGDPMHSWWESISKARTRIQLLSSLLSSPEDDDAHSLSSLADTDRPARSLLLSSSAYFSLSAAISSPSSGAGEDPLCQWLYDTYLSSDSDLRLVVLSYVPLIAATYLHRIHHPSSTNLKSLSGYEAVLLAIYTSETKARNGKPVTISIPDLSLPSLYHSPRNPNHKSSPKFPKPSLVGVVSPPLEPQVAVKSTKRACIIGVALECYYKHISHIPSWSKLDFCKFSAVWAGIDCPCTSEFDHNLTANVTGFENDDDDVNDLSDSVKDLRIEDGNSEKDLRIPLPWELFQPVLRILGHCLLGPLIVGEVKNAASIAVRRLYARASHDLVPQGILATKSLIQLDRRSREVAKLASLTTGSASGSNANTPSKAKKPEILLVSK